MSSSDGRVTVRPGTSPSNLAASSATIRVGAAQGHEIQRCASMAEVVVPVGTRVYDFVWNNDQWAELGKHYPQYKFEKLLAGVTMPDATTARTPLWPSASPTG